MSELASIIIDEPVDVRPAGSRRRTGENDPEDAAVPAANIDMLTDLGVWLAGVESFLAGDGVFRNSTDGTWRSSDRRRKFEIAAAALERCSLLAALELSRPRAAGSAEETAELGGLRNALIAARDSARSASGDIELADAAAVGRQILEPIRAERAFRHLVDRAEQVGGRFLPEPLLTHAFAGSHAEADLAEIALLLPRFGRLLRWLDVVDRMLAADEPLKPALAVFASIYEQVLDLTQAIDRRLKRFPEQESETFAKLDAAAYTASIEVKKVFAQELAAVAGQRQPPSIFAKFETAHSLLNDGFQQMLAGLALEFEPDTDVYEMFPGFRVKQEQSLALRSGLWALARTVQGTERSPEKKAVAALRAELRDFMSNTVDFLFYKDIETFDRFVEEVVAARDNSDLVPILHRFGAYLETLFGQVNLRFVLQDHPFEAQ